MGHWDDGFAPTDVLADLLRTSRSDLDGLFARNVVPGRRDVDGRTWLSLRGIAEWQARRRAIREDAEGAVRAYYGDGVNWNAPLIVDIPRDQWVRGTRSVSSTKSAGSNLIEEFDPVTGRRTVRRRNDIRRDFFPEE